MTDRRSFLSAIVATLGAMLLPVGRLLGFSGDRRIRVIVSEEKLSVTTSLRFDPETAVLKYETVRVPGMVQLVWVEGATPVAPASGHREVFLQASPAVHKHWIEMVQSGWKYYIPLHEFQKLRG